MGTPLKNIGEFGLIRQLSASFHNTQPSTLVGIGDDCAVLDVTQENALLISKDLLLEGIHFDLTYTPLKHLGFKAIAVNVSDVAAMNGLATQILVGIGLSTRFSVEDVEELYSGIRHACDVYNIDLVGGDTSTSLTGLTISVTVIGTAAKQAIVYRRGAEVQDLICVSGDVGAAYLGLQVLEREKVEYQANPDMQPDLAGYDYVVQRLLKPSARVDIVKALAEKGIKPSSMIDVSDGLASELTHLCTASHKGAIIYEEKMPIAMETDRVALEFNIDPMVPALHGGEDYELLFTVPLSDFEKVRELTQISIIGHVTDAAEGVRWISKSGVQMDVKAQGWTHY